MDCRAVASRQKKELNCETDVGCGNTAPSMSDELADLVTCFSLGESQLRMAGDMGYATGLDYNVIVRIADDMGIRTNTTFYRLLKIYENVLITERNEKVKQHAKRKN